MAYYVLGGPEPDYQWERVVGAVIEILDRLQVSLVVSVHGIPMAVPHTRPVGHDSARDRPAARRERRGPFGRVQVPASLAALLELRLGESGRDALGFAVHVPHYLAQAEWAEGALAALNAVVDATGLNLPNDDLVARAGANRAEIAKEVAENDEAGALVTALERQYDAFVEGAQRPSLLATRPPTSRRPTRSAPSSRSSSGPSRTTTPTADPRVRPGRRPAHPPDRPAPAVYRRQSFASDHRWMTAVSATNRTGTPPLHHRAASVRARSTTAAACSAWPSGTWSNSSSWRHSTTCASNASAPARTVATQALNSSAAAPWMTALRREPPACRVEAPGRSRRVARRGTGPSG